MQGRDKSPGKEVTRSYLPLTVTLGHWKYTYVPRTCVDALGEVGDINPAYCWVENISKARSSERTRSQSEWRGCLNREGGAYKDLGFGSSLSLSLLLCSSWFLPIWAGIYNSKRTRGVRWVPNQLDYVYLHTFCPFAVASWDGLNSNHKDQHSQCILLVYSAPA